VSDKRNFAMPLVIREGASERLEASIHLLDLCRPDAFEDLWQNHTLHSIPREVLATKMDLT